MAARALPPHPNVEQYRKQAKELARAGRAGDPAALARLRQHHPRFASAAPPSKLALADAQLVLARELGFPSWPRLRRHLEETASLTPEQIWQRAERALVAGEAGVLGELLRSHGEVLRAGRASMSWSGGLAPSYRQGDARAIIAREHHFADWEQFAAFAAERRQRRSPVARFEAAADAVVAGDVAALARLLRADGNLVRARSRRAHRATLLHYVGANGVEGFRQRTPANAARIAELLLDAGAEVDAVADIYGGYTTLGLVATSIHPVDAGVQDELMALLLSRGAAVGGATFSWSRLINACHANGRPAAAAFLASRADSLDIEAAAGLGRLDLVRSFFDADGALRAPATREQMLDGFTWACEYGHADVVAFLLDRGVDPAVQLPRPHGQTGLHWAAHGGHVELVRLLLAGRVPVDAKDARFDATPLGWALHAWRHLPDGPARDARRQAAVLLVAAGATVDPDWIGDPAIRTDDGLLAVLQRGIGR